MAFLPWKRRGHDDRIADWAQQFERMGDLSAVYVTVVTSASTAVQSFPHPLGKAFRFAVLAGQSDLANAVTTGSPDASLDSSRLFSLKQAVASSQTVSVRLVP